jgi:transposase
MMRGVCFFPEKELSMEWTETMQKELRQASRHDRRGYVRTKALALVKLTQGHRLAQVAGLLEVSRQAVYDWVGAYERLGLQGLVVQKGRGRKPTADLVEIVRYVRQSPRAFGCDRTRWTLALLAAVVPSLKGFSAYGVQKALRRAGISYKRGQPWIHSPDPQYEQKKTP